MSLSDFLHELWYGKSRYSAEERLLRAARSRRASFIRRLTGFVGLGGGLVAINYMSNGLQAFWAGYPLAIFGGLLAISTLRYAIWLSDNRQDLERARKKVALMQTADMKLLERSSRSRVVTERVAAAELLEACLAAADKARGAVAALDAQHAELAPLIDRHLVEVRKMINTLSGLEGYLAEEDLEVLLAEQQSLDHRLAQAADETVKRELQATRDLLAARTRKLAELEVEADRIRARVQAAQQSLENLRAEAAHLKTAELQDQAPVASAGEELGRSVERLRRELETMQKERAELDALDVRPASVGQAARRSAGELQ